MNDWMRGRHVLVTGAAGGIGAATVKRYLAGGAKVTACDLRKCDPELWADPGSGPGTVEPVVLDVTSPSSVDEVFAAAQDQFGTVDVLVNGAGIIIAKDMLEMSADDWDAVQAVNAKGLFLCLQAFARQYTDDSGGSAGHRAVPPGATSPSVVNIASVAGIDGKTMSAAYAASKAAVLTITRTAARQLADCGVRVNAVCPGIIDTEFNLRLGEQFGPAQGLSPREFVERRAEPVPLHRLGLPEEVAAAIAFLSSPDASYVTGQALNIDGGLVMC